MKQRKLEPEVIDWDKIYVNRTNNKVFIFQEKEKINLLRIITHDEFKEALKKVPTINWLLVIFT